MADLGKRVLLAPCKKPSFTDKIWYSFLAGLLFLIVANPVTFKILRNAVGHVFGKGKGSYFADDRGCATSAGLLVHTGVFTVLIFLLMLVTEAINEDFVDYW
jgi:hypothetical protein